MLPSVGRWGDYEATTAFRIEDGGVRVGFLHKLPFAAPSRFLIDGTNSDNGIGCYLIQIVMDRLQQASTKSNARLAGLRYVENA